MKLRKRLVVGVALAVLLTGLMGMLAFLSNAHRQVKESYEVQSAMLQERELQLKEKEAELAALQEKNKALIDESEARRAQAEAMLDQVQELETEKKALQEQTEQLRQSFEEKRLELQDGDSEESYYLEVYNALTEGLNKVKEYIAGN